VTSPLSYRTTFHDPLHLGRFNQGYDAPRDILALLGCELVEMTRNRSNILCCGAGAAGSGFRIRRIGEARAKSHQGSRRDSGPSGHVVELPEGSDDVRGRPQDHRQRGQVSWSGIDELIREALPAPAPRKHCMKILVAGTSGGSGEGLRIHPGRPGRDPDFLHPDLNEWDDFALEEGRQDQGSVVDAGRGRRPLGGSGRRRRDPAQVPGEGSGPRRFASGTTPSRVSDPIAIARIIAAAVRREAPGLVSPASNPPISRMRPRASPRRRFSTGPMPPW